MTNMTSSETRELRIAILKMSVEIAKTEYSAGNTSPERVLTIAAELEKYIIKY